jgi:dTDP-4-amino-4,6-dideoxygalactose transaminase
VEPARRDEILRDLGEKGIGVAVNYRAIHTLTFFREHFQHAPQDYPVANLIGSRTLSLPLYPSLTDAEIDSVIAAVKQVFGSSHVFVGQCGAFENTID